MNILRRLLQYPIGLLHVALVVYSHRSDRPALRRLVDATLVATAVIALSVLVVYVAGHVGAVPY